MYIHYMVHTGYNKKYGGMQVLSEETHLCQKIRKKIWMEIGMIETFHGGKY